MVKILNLQKWFLLLPENKLVMNNEVPFKTVAGLPPIPPDIFPQPVAKHTDLSPFLEGCFEGKHAG